MINSIVQQPPETLGQSFVISFANAYDRFPQWGTDVFTRDRLLREFWPTEPMLASAMFSTVSKYTAFGWNLEGPRRQVNAVRNMLHNCEHGKGWNSLNSKILIDLFSQDNGAFIEIVRRDDTESGVVVQLNHLDSARCFRTGRWDYPVIYRDYLSQLHKLAWYQVGTIEEFPSPIETQWNRQYCTITRMLTAARVLKDIQTYKHEKVSGRYTRAIHLVSGVNTKQVNDAIRGQQEQADERLVSQYIQPLVIGSINPTANVSSTTIDMASLPDGFDEETTMRWYINQLALAFGADYQDFAPLPGGNLGSAHQAEVLHLKSRGKGPALYMSTLEHLFNFHGIMPQTVRFRFGEQDVALDTELEKLRNMRAQTLTTYVKEGVLSVEVARQIMMDNGDLEERYLEMFGETNATPNVIISSSKGAEIVKRIERDEMGRISAVVESVNK